MTKNFKIIIFIACLHCFILSGCGISDQSANSTIAQSKSIIETPTQTKIFTPSLSPKITINETPTQTNNFTPSLSPALGQTILARSLDVHVMALDNDNIYLITRVVKQVDNDYVESNRIEWIPKSGGKITTLVEENLDYSNLTIDDNYIYWIAVSQADSEKYTQYIKKIRKTGGRPIIMYQEDSFLRFSNLDEKYLFLISRPKNNSGITCLLQINKSDNSIQIISENKEQIDDIIVHGGYVYWSAWTYDLIKHEINGQIRRK